MKAGFFSSSDKLLDRDLIRWCCKSPSGTRSTFVVALFATLLIASSATSVQGQRVLGLDLAAWQGNISQTTWNNIYNVENREFVFIRSTRGGTTGEDHRQGGYPSGNNSFFNLSQRYDDPYFVQNINRATTAGLLAGPYHFARPDIIASTPNSGGIPNTGTDEANHFIEMAGAWMRPGFLLPTFDLEAGDTERSANDLAQFTIDFSDGIHDVMGIRPNMYINGNYSTILQSASSSLRTQVVNSFPHLWDARYEFQSHSQAAGDAGALSPTAHPMNTFAGFYGPWDDFGETHPWDFWQYRSTGRLPSYNNGNSNLDFNVAQGGIEFVKDRLVPALWMNDSSGDWTTLINWNSGQTPTAPIQAPGQLAPIGTQTLPTERLPTEDDTVILDRPSASITVTLPSGTHNIRKLEVRETLNITGGSLTVNYVPSADSTPLSAQFSAPVSLSGGSLSVHTLQVDPTQTFSLGGDLTFDTIFLMPDASSPARIDVIGDVDLSPLANASAEINNGIGSGNPGLIDLGGADRTFDVSNGSADEDVVIKVPMQNGGLLKTGAGTLALQNSNSIHGGDTTISEGILSISSPLFANSSDLYLTTGATLDLDYSGNTDVIDSLFIDGVSQAIGVWGAPGSGAPFTTPLIAGFGKLQVSTFVQTLAGDYNENGVVDLGDYNDWLDNVGAPAGTLPNDTDGGVIGQAQYNTWKANFGLAGTGSGAGATIGVPEPASWVILFGVCMFFSFVNRLPRN